MTVNRTTLLDLPLPVSGTESGTWGDTTNNGLTQYMDIAIAGMSNLTSANFAAGALTIETTEGTSSATNITATSAQYAGFRVTSLATNSTITVGNTGTSPARSYRLINADSTYTLTFKATGQTGVTLQPGQSAVVAFNGTDYVFIGAVGPGSSLNTPLAVVGNATAGAEIRLPEDTDNGSNYVALKAPDTLASNLTFTLPSADGTNGQVITTNGSGTLSFTSVAAGDVTAAGNNAFTGANTFYNATGQAFAPATTNDGIILQGRAGGSSSYRVTFATATLSANRTLTFPDATDTAAVLGTAQTFTAAQTFRAASAIRSEAASTQDAVVIAGRAGGTSSYAITLTPATLSASRTLTLPEPGEDVTLGYLNVPQNIQTGSYTLVLADAGKHIYRGSGSAATWTIPANGSVAYPIGTALTFINLSATSVSIAITTDTMYLSSAGTTGTRTLAQYGSATAVKITSTSWIISGSGLT